MSINTEGLLSLKSHMYSIQLAISYKAAMVFDTGIVPREEASYHVRGIIIYIVYTTSKQYHVAINCLQ